MAAREDAVATTEACIKDAREELEMDMKYHLNWLSRQRQGADIEACDALIALLQAWKVNHSK